MKKKILELLYRSFENSLSSEEKKILQDELEGSEELQTEKRQITAMRATISAGAQKSFKPFFPQRIIQRIREQERNRETFVESLFYIFKPVAIAATILFFALISYNLITSDHVSLANAFAEPEVTLEQVFDPTLHLTME